MKIYVNREPVYGPWGGGAKTVIALVESLKSAGHEVVFRLCHDIDVIFCIDPRPNKYGEWYQHFLNYKNQFGTKIVHRVGDVGTHSKPELTSLVKQTVQYSDFLIFPSEWAKEWINFQGNNFQVVHNCPMKQFHQFKNTAVEIGDKVKLVTHHWSTNPKKGFHFYKQLENYIQKTNKYEFSYIGRKPDSYSFTNYIQPIGAERLAAELPKHHIYITASIEEAGANHVLEAMACGLPVVFHKDGGSIVNYCEDYGLKFSSFDEMIQKIDQMAQEYKTYKAKVLSYDNNIEQVKNKYLEIILEVSRR